MKTYFLHIGKTGGTALKHALAPIADAHDLVLLMHRDSLADVPVGSRVIFCVRDPTSRFVSGFNSRLRQGMPRRFIAWRPEEERAFALFRTPNALAEALAGPMRESAVEAMNGIAHVRDRLSKWLVSPQYLQSRADDILLVCDQARLSDDFEVIKSALGLPAGLCLPQGDVDAHRTPAGMDTHLSDVAKANLTEWYEPDEALYRLAKALKAAPYVTVI